MSTELIIGLLAGDTILAGALSSIITSIVNKRKYNSEVDHNNIQNMQESLDFYTRLADDYRTRLSNEIESHNKEVEELRKENAELKREMREQEKKFDDILQTQQREISAIKNQMISVYSQVCLNFKCAKRVTTEENSEAAKPKKSKKVKE